MPIVKHTGFISNIKRLQMSGTQTFVLQEIEFCILLTFCTRMLILAV